MNPGIQALRGIAVLLTLWNHTPWRWPGAWTGVDLFLVISGYVIASSYDGQMLAFWRRRAWRILPTAWIGIAFSLALLPLATNVDAAVVAFLQVADFFPPWGENALGHYWSLSLEEQFYLVLPLAIAWLPRRWLIAVLTLAVAVQLPLDRAYPSSLWFLRTDGLCLGVLLALVPQLRLRISPRLSHALVACLLALMVSSANVSIAALCAFVIVGLVANQPFRFPLLEWIGYRSFSLYVLQMPLFVVLPVWLAMPASVAAAAANYRWVEVPSRARGAQSGQWNQTPPACQ